MPLINSETRLDNDWVMVAAPVEGGESQSPLLSDVINEPVSIIVDWAIWQDHKAELLARAGAIGVKIDGDIELSELVDDLDKLALVAVDFPSFADGRGFSFARMLKQSYGFKGEVRAVGAVTWDRLRFMKRCGFDTFDIPDDRFDDAIFKAFTEVQVSLQGAADDPRPIYRQ